MPPQRPVPASVPSLPCACAELRRAARAVTRLYDAAIRPMGLRLSQFTLLQALSLTGGALKQGTLGEILALDTTTLTRTLRPLQGAKWIRSFAGADGRERYIEITPLGRRVLERATPAWERVQDRLKATLGSRDWTALERVTMAAVVAAQASSETEPAPLD
jgi:DNA-binding MarR family transcriptional regulator